MCFCSCSKHRQQMETRSIVLGNFRQCGTLFYRVRCIHLVIPEIEEDIPVPDSLWQEATFIKICISSGGLKCLWVLISSKPSFGNKVICWYTGFTFWDLYIAVYLQVYCLSSFSWGIPILTVQECQSYSQFHICNFLSQIWLHAFARFLRRTTPGGPKLNCHSPGPGAPILCKLLLLPPGGKNVSFVSGIQWAC